MVIPLKKSRIRVKTEEGARKIIISPTGPTVLFGGVLLTLFVCLYFLAIYLRGTFDPPLPFEPFSNPSHSLVAILGFGVFLLCMVQAWERRREIFHLKSSGMDYFTQGLVGASQNCVFTQEQLATLKLRKRPDGSRLFIHNGNEQVELVPDISVPEREWLYKQIKEKYSLR